MTTIPTTLGAVAAVLATVAALLLAVIVFGLQFHGERLGYTYFLVRYLGRREGVAPIAAVLLSVVAGNCAVAALAVMWTPAVGRLVLPLDVALVPVALLLSFRLLYRIVKAVSGDFYEDTLEPGLRYEYRRALAEEQHRLIENMFPVRRSFESDLPKVIAEFTDNLVSLARYDTTPHLRKALKVFVSLAEMELTLRPGTTTDESRIGSLAPSVLRALGGTGFHRLADAVASIADPEKTQTLFQMAGDLMRLARRHHQPQLFYDAGVMVQVVYTDAIEYGSHVDETAQYVALLAHDVLGSFAGRRRPSRRRVQWTSEEMRVLKAAIGWVLALIKTAAESDRVKDGHYLHTYLIGFDRALPRGRPHTQDRDETTALRREVLDIHEYAHIALGSWLLHLASKPKTRCAAVTQTLAEVVKALGARENLIRVWERFSTHGWFEAPIQEELGLRLWSLPTRSPWFPGDWENASGYPERWVFDGLIALALARRRGSVEDTFGECPPPPPFDWPVKDVKSIASRWFKADKFAEKVLGIKPEEQEDRLRQLVELLEQRNQCRESQGTRHT